MGASRGSLRVILAPIVFSIVCSSCIGVVSSDQPHTYVASRALPALFTMGFRWTQKVSVLECRNAARPKLSEPLFAVRRKIASDFTRRDLDFGKTTSVQHALLETSRTGYTLCFLLGTQ